MNRKALTRLYRKLGNAMDNFDKANDRLGLGYASHQDVLDAQQRLQQIEAQVDSAEETLGERECPACGKWIFIDDDCCC